MLDLTKLRYAVALSRHLNYARTAERCGISQPALSRAIQGLEAQLGIRLFDRDRSGVALTPQGRDFIDRAAVLVANADDLERRARLASTGARGRSRFGMAPMAARALLADVLRERIVEAPQLTNEVLVRNVDTLWPLLTAGEIEFFVSAEGQVPDAPPVRKAKLGSFPLTLLVRAGHPLLSGHASAQACPVLISSNREFALPDDLQHVTVQPAHVIEDFQVLSDLAVSTDALWITSAHAARPELASGALVALPTTGLPEPARYNIVMYSLDNRTQSPAALAIREHMIRLIAAFNGGTVDD